MVDFVDGGDDGVGGGLLEDGINHTICFIQLDV